MWYAKRTIWIQLVMYNSAQSQTVKTTIEWYISSSMSLFAKRWYNVEYLKSRTKTLCCLDYYKTDRKYAARSSHKQEIVKFTQIIFGHHDLPQFLAARPTIYDICICLDYHVHLLWISAHLWKFLGHVFLDNYHIHISTRFILTPYWHLHIIYSYVASSKFKMVIRVSAA